MPAATHQQRAHPQQPHLQHQHQLMCHHLPALFLLLWRPLLGAQGHMLLVQHRHCARDQVLLVQRHLSVVVVALLCRPVLLLSPHATCQAPAWTHTGTLDSQE